MNALRKGLVALFVVSVGASVGFVGCDDGGDEEEMDAAVGGEGGGESGGSGGSSSKGGSGGSGTAGSGGTAMAGSGGTMMTGGTGMPDANMMMMADAGVDASMMQMPDAATPDAATPDAASPDTAPDAMTATLVINEVNAEGTDWIEFKNVSGSEIDISGWSFADDGNNTFTFPQDTQVAAGAYLTLTQNEAGSFTFGLGGNDAVILKNSGGMMVDIADWATGQASDGKTFGRIPDGTGDFLSLSTPTKNAANQPNP